MWQKVVFNARIWRSLTVFGMTIKPTVILSETKDLLNVAESRVQCPYMEIPHCVRDDDKTNRHPE
ncbi:hypothetical protein I5282_08475 [Legionella sp. 30cs62]|uniref:Uncharacterized protein n=1 Tax=Legionella bononiensis TaxID=2793102 RepID=A0ABS1WB70_9GAMM|nr:hypothetical protein [Legionella bononiensis]